MTTDSSMSASEHPHAMTEREVSSERVSEIAALPPVDGLKVVMEKICHKEQIGIWANEVTSALALSDFLREEWTFDDSVDLEREIAAQLLDIIKSAFTHPGLDLVASLSQASSVIAGLNAERDEAIRRGEDQWAGWVKEEVARKAAEARISSLEEENKRQKAALEKIAQEQIQTNFGPWPTKGSEIARQALGDHNG